MSKKQPTSTLDAASDRLAKAFAQLEKAIAARPAVTPGDADAIKSWESHCATLEADLASARDENEALKKENAALSNQLQVVQRDYVELQKLATSVADKLDEKATQLELIG